MHTLTRQIPRSHSNPVLGTSGDATEFKGILYKHTQGLIKRWAPRLFRLTRTTLSYSHSDSPDAIAEWSIDTCDITSVCKTDETRLTITMRDKTVYEFKTKTDDQLDAWARHLDSVIQVQWSKKLNSCLNNTGSTSNSSSQLSLTTTKTGQPQPIMLTQRTNTVRQPARMPVKDLPALPSQSMEFFHVQRKDSTHLYVSTSVGNLVTNDDQPQQSSSISKNAVSLDQLKAIQTSGSKEQVGNGNSHGHLNHSSSSSERLQVSSQSRLNTPIYDRIMEDGVSSPKSPFESYGHHHHTQSNSYTSTQRDEKTISSAIQRASQVTTGSIVASGSTGSTQSANSSVPPGSNNMDTASTIGSERDEGRATSGFSPTSPRFPSLGRYGVRPSDLSSDQGHLRGSSAFVLDTETSSIGSQQTKDRARLASLNDKHATLLQDQSQSALPRTLATPQDPVSMLSPTTAIRHQEDTSRSTENSSFPTSISPSKNAAPAYRATVHAQYQSAQEHLVLLLQAYKTQDFVTISDSVETVKNACQELTQTLNAFLLLRVSDHTVKVDASEAGRLVILPRLQLSVQTLIASSCLLASKNTLPGPKGDSPPEVAEFLDSIGAVSTYLDQIMDHARIILN